MRCAVHAIADAGPPRLQPRPAFGGQKTAGHSTDFGQPSKVQWWIMGFLLRRTDHGAASAAAIRRADRDAGAHERQCTLPLEAFRCSRPPGRRRTDGPAPRLASSNMIEAPCSVAAASRTCSAHGEPGSRTASEPGFPCDLLDRNHVEGWIVPRPELFARKAVANPVRSVRPPLEPFPIVPRPGRRGGVDTPTGSWAEGRVQVSSLGSVHRWRSSCRRPRRHGKSALSGVLCR